MSQANQDFLCPNCETGLMAPFYEVNHAPVHSVLLLRDRDTAVNFPAQDIVLGFCARCGFISNIVFDDHAQDYSAEYEATQGFSPTFNTFHQKLAQDLIAKYDLRNKHIVEIGCGMGEFLHLMCELGNNRGTGFDPAYRLERSLVGQSSQINVIADYYSEKYSEFKADFFCCKMTLEHIPNKAHTYMAGTGQEIMTPDQLPTVQPDIVLIMNPIYKNEIQANLESMDLHPEILTL